MPLLEPPPTPPADTPAQAFARVTLATLAAHRDGLEQVFNGLMSSVWDDAPHGLTPADRIAALDDRAGPLFQVAAMLREVIVAADPTAADRLRQTPAEYADRLVFHGDGTVTIDPLA